jgi:GTP-binding protein HflX
MGVLPHGENTVCISARTGEGLDKLKKSISTILNADKYHAIFRIPYSRGDIVSLLQAEAAVLQLEYAEDGTVMEAIVKPEIWGRVKQFSNIPERQKEAWE